MNRLFAWAKAQISATSVLALGRKRDVDCSHLFAMEPLFRRWPRATAVAAVLFVLLANGLGGAIDVWGM